MVNVRTKIAWKMMHIKHLNPIEVSYKDREALNTLSELKLHAIFTH